MSKTTNRRQALEEARLRHQLELQSQQIERVFNHHLLSARVEGGHVHSQAVRFDLQTQLANGWERLRTIKDDLTAVLGVSGVQLHRENGRWQLQVERPEAPPVALLDLLSLLDDVPTATAVLGLAEDGQPVLLNFLDPNTRHVLLAGGPQAGKTVLLRSIALSLALLNRQSQLQLLVIDTERSPTSAGGLQPLNYLPHLLQDVVQNVKLAAELLAFLADEMAYRQEQLAQRPTVVVLIDNVVTLLRTGENSIASNLLRLLQHGADVGIHLVLGTRRPEAPELRQLRRVDIPVRLVGRLHDAQEAQAAAEIPRSRAEYLLGEGDFLAIADGIPRHFQVAFASDYDLHLSLRQLHANQPPKLLAQPFIPRPMLPSATNGRTEHAFSLAEDHSVSLQPAAAKRPTVYPQPMPMKPVLLLQEEPVVYEVETADLPVAARPPLFVAEAPLAETPSAATDEVDVLPLELFETAVDDDLDLPFFGDEETADLPEPTRTPPKVSLEAPNRRPTRIPFLDDLDEPAAEAEDEDDEQLDDVDELAFLDELDLPPARKRVRPMVRKRPLNMRPDQTPVEGAKK